MPTYSEVVGSLPTKRIFDLKTYRIRESTKLPKEFTTVREGGDELIMRVKLVGINYQTDFAAITYWNTDKKTLVPSSKIVGKLITDVPAMNLKYLVFPFTNCINQKRISQCKNCEKLASSEPLNSLNIDVWARYKCTENLIYGFTIDGGMQDYMRIPSPSETLLPIPNNLSLHDACFLTDIALPLYTCILENFIQMPRSPVSLNGDEGSSTVGTPNFMGNILLVLLDIQKEINDVLIVLKYFRVPELSFSVIDARKYASLLHNDKVRYLSRFTQVFVFYPHPELVAFATHCLYSLGLEATKSRYNLILFDQFHVQSLVANKNLSFTDRTVQHFKLSYKDRIYAEQLLQIVSELNANMQKSLLSSSLSVDLTLEDGNRSTFSNFASCQSTQTLLDKTQKTIRFREGDSIINEKMCSSSNSSDSSDYALSRAYSWLWYDRDFVLCKEFEHSDDEDGCDDTPGRVHAAKQINRLIRNPRHINRACYTNQANRPKLNALIFS